ncbi:hypothetical protein ILUMI_14998 [Ignelater luminosus]|uniref:Uncharacterized protein n=1 Tax=Ignelater luminosus TaxID=2038154 RepID=A0A8K0CXH6_IGNLU|nr:hypothetical protein ILUMI_14998 [Ignelater luminosus]
MPASSSSFVQDRPLANFLENAEDEIPQDTTIPDSQFEEIAASINMPMMAYETYNRHQQRVIDVIHETDGTPWKMLAKKKLLWQDN